MEKKVLFILLLLCLTAHLYSQLTLKITSLPPSTPAGASLYVAGTFNNWQAGDERYKFSADQQGIYRIPLDIPPGMLEFKITRGDWDTVEGDRNGNFRPNRQLNYTGGALEESITILSWQDLDANGSGSTAASNVHILSQRFPMPQLGRERRIWIYLPPGYETGDLRYPVLYMQDGQNVFDASTSFSGEWQVDETLNRLALSMERIIVVAVDNGGSHRIDEYSPWVNEVYGGGEGDEYLEFMVETLKPYVDQNYRTRPEREYTGIMGSSMGGLISLYGAIEFQQTFGKAGILSPSLWFSEDALEHVALKGAQNSVDFYLLAGVREGASVISDLYALSNTLNAAGFHTQEQFLATHPDGEHAEWYWAREFGDIARWLYDDWEESQDEAKPPLIDIQVKGRGNRQRLEVAASTDFQNLLIRLTRPDGAIIVPRTAMNDEKLGIPNVGPGEYLAWLYLGDQLLVVERLEVR